MAYSFFYMVCNIVCKVLSIHYLTLYRKSLQNSNLEEEYNLSSQAIMVKKQSKIFGSNNTKTLYILFNFSELCLISVYSGNKII